MNNNLKKYIFNVNWLFLEKIFRILAGFMVTIFLARYLGPEKFGTFSYAISFVAIFAILATFGFDKTISKELISEEFNKEKILGTSFFIRLVGSLLFIPIVIFMISIVRPDNDFLVLMVLIISIGLVFKSFEVIKYWFESQVQAKYGVIVDFSVILIFSIIKIIAISNDATLITFAWIVCFESLITGFGLLWIYIYKSNKISKWKFSFDKMKYLLKESYPIILTGAVYSIFIKIDQVMLGSMIGDTSVGIYAAASKISEAWLFIPTVVAIAFYPAMLNARNKSYDLYLARTQSLLNLMGLLGFIVGVFIFFLSPYMIDLIYGIGYSESSLILIIHIWGTLFTAISMISLRYFLTEGLQIYSFYRAFAGCILNIILNYILIPIYGAIGAAIATTISQIVAVYILNAFHPKTRVMFIMQSKALSLIYSLNTIRDINIIRRNK